MATNEQLATRRRIPKLSEQPEGPNGRYYTSYRDAKGKCQRQRFSRDRKESEQAYRRWVIEHYDDSADIVIRDGAGRKDALEQTLPYIANAFIKHDEGRVRADGTARKKGTISLRVFDDDRRQVVNILKWAKVRFGNRLKQESFAALFTETDYEVMMMDFAKRLSASQVNKHRQRFWQIVNFAKRRPIQVRLPFGPDDVQHFGGVDTKRARVVPTVKMIQTILKAADERERLWIWLGIGLGFGNDDLARVCPVHFDRDSYDMRRGKTGFDRYGKMWPMVWANLQAYLKSNACDRDDLLFRTRTGRPLVWVKAKTDEELKNGTTTRKACNTPYKRSDSVWQKFRKLKKRAGLGEWPEGFYIWRHLGATAYATRDDVGLAALRTFLGHGKSDAADQYLKPLTPQVKEVVEWVNRMLDSDDLNAWTDKEGG